MIATHLNFVKIEFIKNLTRANELATATKRTFVMLRKGLLLLRLQAER
jgi:hypothetical protein